MKIGITSTIPVEIPLAAGHTVIDLNNLFITDPDPSRLIAAANAGGLPAGQCGWIRGIFPLVGECDEIVIVGSGDCSNLVAMGEIVEKSGVRVALFDYPRSRDYDDLVRSMSSFAARYATTLADAVAVKVRLDRIRRKIGMIDLATWREMTVTGFENHLYHVSATDFGGDPDAFEIKVDNFLAEIEKRVGVDNVARLAFVGVPPIITDIYDVIESMGARVVYNEVQREFAMNTGHGDIVRQYLDYTYPYHIEGRRRVIEAEVKRRAIDGVILYHERFCYRNLNSSYFAATLGLPCIEIEGGDPAPTDERTKIRLETFIDMIGAGVRR